MLFFIVVLGADGEEDHRDKGRVGRGEGCGGIWGGDTDQQRVLLLIQEYSLVILFVILQLILGLILSSWYFTRYGRSMAFHSIPVLSAHTARNNDSNETYVVRDCGINNFFLKDVYGTLPHPATPH